ncbi:MAG: hypothetical protein ETSY1_37785 [Candidatus Entotheonella factor]|uniref:N-acetyltransferase domain-containing protein n=1 Tax=Entotheonella factor TaxID=1429438 RepID=W4L8W1_ENTF1|nr:GNAT family N-acetyltransferase [Candidatus Entotheonella palauensis]ETW93771.1 MAG: hypothetical protein ETSY1_37785 [Candidatus Entotheonella factor]
MRIRNYQPSDAREIADLFHDTIHAIGAEYYSKEQTEAWAPTPPDYGHWQRRLDRKQPFVAEIDQKIVGFIELDPDGHIDCMYTHKDYQRQGIASQLYDHLQRIAHQQGIQRLYVEASKLARPFFEARGFRLVKENTIERRGQQLINYSMELNELIS